MSARTISMDLDSNDGSEAVCFPLRGETLTTLRKIPVKTLLSLGKIIDLTIELEEEAKKQDNEEGEADVVDPRTFQLFGMQVDVVKSLLTSESKTKFQNIIDCLGAAAENPIDGDDLGEITRVLIEELSGNDKSESGVSSPTTSKTNSLSTEASSERGMNLLTHSDQLS